MHPVVSAYRSAANCLSRRGPFSLRVGRGGAVALITAICAPILLLIVGFTADYAYASYINQQLARATDNATVGSISQSSATAAGGYGNLTAMHDTGVSIFNANTAQLPATTGAAFSLTVASDGKGGVTARGTYTMNVPTFFSTILGYNAIPVSGSASTSAKPLVYVNYYILVDTSQSMGIAATAADMTTLYNAVVAAKNSSGSEVGCVFACHVIAVDQTTAKVSNEVIARQNNVSLRIDAAVTAVKSIISQAQNIAGSSLNIKFGLYKIQQDPYTNLMITTVATPQNTYAALQAAASTIDLGNNTPNFNGDSDFPDELTAFNQILINSNVTANGTGATATSPLNYFIIVTDGLADITCGLYCHTTNAIDPTNCTQLKNKGTVGVVYTIYNPIYANNNPSQGFESLYNTLVAGAKANSIKPNLQSCTTSTDFYFEASDGPDIVSAMQTLFQQTQASSARLTQ